MDVRSLYRQMASYDQWRSELQTQLLAFQAWFDHHKIKSQQARLSLRQAIALLANNYFSIACVGEFSRGKTELINALLYLDNGQRLLPSRPGRTTMCPTEIFYDPEEGSCVRLLPIETRRSSTSVESFRQIPEKWVTHYFSPDDREQVAEAMAQIAATKTVTEDEALAMGFDQRLLSRSSLDEKLVEIPAWRHALINLQHPLLRQGLCIVDTPGLNALGNEPELTLKTLPRAQAIIFLLAADTGLTNSDMTIWKEHIEVLRRGSGTSVVVLLNKIDTLWDDLSSPDEMARSIREVREITARQLQLPIEDVVPISAKEGLLAKASGDKSRLLRSSLLKMEMLLSEQIVDNQRKVANHRSIRDALTIMHSTHKLLTQRTEEGRRQLQALSKESSPRAKLDALESLRRNIKAAHTSYHKQALSLRSSQRLLDNQRQALLGPVNPLLLEQVISSTLSRLNQSWTTIGLARAINEFFEILEQTLRNMSREAERANQVLKAIYKRSEHQEAGADEMLDRHLFSLDARQRQFVQLKHQANQYRLSLDTLFVSKHKVIERFVHTLVREVRALYLDLEADVRRWAEEALSPLFHHNLYQKQLLERHMMQLANLNNNGRSVESQINTLQASIAAQEQALKRLNTILQNHADTAPAKGRHDKVVNLDSRRSEQVGLS